MSGNGDAGVVGGGGGGVGSLGGVGGYGSGGDANNNGFGGNGSFGGGGYGYSCDTSGCTGGGNGGFGGGGCRGFNPPTTSGGFGAGNGGGSACEGGGGAGLGGAVFAKTGTMTLKTVTFDTNTSTRGTGTNNGKGLGGAIFICDASVGGAECSATVSASSCGVTFTGTTNTASNAGSTTTDNANFFGNLPAGATTACSVPITAGVSMVSVTDVKATTALAAGTASGTGVTERGFFWWNDETYWGANASGLIPAGSGAGDFSLTLGNLPVKTQLYVSAYMKIGGQVITSGAGNFISITTTDPMIPTVITKPDFTVSGSEVAAKGETVLRR